jgi:hypothetical protein
MPLAPEIRALMGQELVVSERISSDVHGTWTYAERNSSPVKCYATFGSQRVWSVEGKEEVTSLVCYCDASDIDPDDQFEFDGTSYRCLNVETWYDDQGVVVGQVVNLQ